MKEKVYCGKRKTAVARVIIKDGTSKVTINKKPIDFFSELNQLELKEPLMIAQEVLGKDNFNITVNVVGGGLSSRIEASRLAIAKAIVGFTKSDKLKAAYLRYDRNMLVADTRRKEACKPGDSKARAKRQSSKR